MSSESTPVACCANHACAKEIDLAKDTPNVLCPLCASPEILYCSEACRMTDWISHKCDNAFLVSATIGQKETTLFVPYHFEDTLSPKEQKQWLEALTPAARIEAENQHALLQVRHPDQSVTQHLMPLSDRLTFRPMDPKFETVFRRGIEPREEVKRAAFRITLTFNDSISIVMTGTVDERAIYKGHAPAGTQIVGNRIIEYLLNRRKESDDTVLFVTPDDADRYKELPLSGNVVAEVQVNNNIITTASGPYKMRAFGFEFTRAIGKFLNPRLKALFPDPQEPIKNFKMLRATLGHTEMILFFQVPRHKKLRNIDPTDNIMFFRGLVYQVAADSLVARSKLVTSARKPASVAVESGKPSPVPPLFPPPPGRDDRDLWTEETGEGPPTPRRDDEIDVSQVPPPPVLPSEVQKRSTVVSFVTPPQKESAEPLSPPPESPPPMPEGWSAGPLARTPTNQSPPESPRPDTPPPPESLVDALAKRRAAIKPQDEDDDDMLLDEAAMDFRRATTFSLRCDASDVSQLVGLAMALELRERELPAHASMPASVVRNHARALMEKRIEDPSQVPMDVSAAVYSAIQALHELPVKQ